MYIQTNNNKFVDISNAKSYVVTDSLNNSMGRYGLHKTKPTLSDLANVAVFVPSIKYFVGKNSSAPSQINLIDNVDGYARVRLERLGTSQKSQDGATILRVNHTFKKGDYIFAGGLIIGIK